MPLYEYCCEICGKKIEVEHKISETPEIECNCSFGYMTGDLQLCGFPKMKRQISKTTFQLKGSGWGKDKYGK